MPHPLLFKKVTLARLRNLLAIDQAGTWASAGRIMLRETGEGTANSVKGNIEVLEGVLGKPLVREEDGRQVLTEYGEQLKSSILQMMYLWEGIGRLGSSSYIIAFLPQHAFFVSRVIRDLHGDIAIHPHVLNERDRNVDTFETRVIGPLVGGETDIVVGPPAPPSARRITELTRHYLYTSRLEAMLPRRDVRTQVTVQELIDEGKMLVPPLPTRSRKLLEETIAKHAANDPGPGERVFLEAYGTKVLVAFGEEGHGTVVVPSDIAYPFVTGHSLAGPEAEGFKWVPVVSDTRGEVLTHDVFATTRAHPDPAILKIVEAIKVETASRQLNVKAGSYRPEL